LVGSTAPGGLLLKLLPFLWVMVKPLPQLSARASVLLPAVDFELRFADAPRPKPFNEEPYSLVAPR
jgi:hypothetical protein